MARIHIRRRGTESIQSRRYDAADRCAGADSKPEGGLYSHSSDGREDRRKEVDGAKTRQAQAIKYQFDRLLLLVALVTVVEWGD